jgi:hypothetical protein
MAVNGLLVAGGQGSALRSRLTDGTFDFGHILSVATWMFKPWASDWLRLRLDHPAGKYSAASTWLIDGV